MSNIASIMSLFAQTRKYFRAGMACKRLCDTRSVDTADRIVSLAAVDAARERIRGHVHRTPMLSSSTAARLIERGRRAATRRRPAPRQGRASPEDGLVQDPWDESTGSSRSATRSARAGVITVSAGNAAQACAWAARAVGVPATVIMPEARGPLEARRLP